ncbi:prolactin-inducible protein [Elephas maximus indicus]|uniref:prolactin-inducible protein n=1 Tax=Elephas maximus indicus TaxID=99487 RepID=UPI002116BD4A|nr:prolactin-inducible protein [Elephas maximus indicus]
MSVLLLLSRAGPAALLLVLYLQMGASNTTEGSGWNVITLDLQVQQTAEPKEEVPVTLKLTSEVKECLVVKTYLKSSGQLEGASHDYKFTACLCEDYPRTFFWDIQSNYTVEITAVVDVIRQLNICPEDRAVIPIKANRFYTFRTLQII